MLWYKHVSVLKAPNKSATYSSLTNIQDEQFLWKSLEKALNENAALETQKYLALWLGNITQDKQAPMGQSLKAINNESLSQAFNVLLASRYAKNHSEWQSKELHQILRKIRKDGNIDKKTRYNLSPLYPAP
jgi:hypothetical protein